MSDDRPAKLIMDEAYRFFQWFSEKAKRELLRGDPRLPIKVNTETFSLRSTGGKTLLEPGGRYTIDGIAWEIVEVRDDCIVARQLPKFHQTQTIEDILSWYGWQPIGWAPRDGTRLLLWDPKRKVAVSGRWHSDPGRDSPLGYEPPWAWWVADDDLILWDSGPDDGPTFWQSFTPPEEADAPSSGS